MQTKQFQSFVPNPWFHVCITYLSFYNACNFMICDLHSKGEMDHLTFLHEIIAIMLIYYCQIQFVLQNNFRTLNSGFHRLRTANKFSNSQEQRRIEDLHEVKISGDKRLKLFVAIWFSNFVQKDLTIALSVIFSVIDGTIFFFPSPFF